MDKQTIDTICWWIPFRKLRDSIRKVLYKITSHDIYYDHFVKYNSEILFQFFMNKKVDSNTILLIEYFGWHSECLSGYIKYFKDLGYNVHLVLNYNLNDQWDSRLFIEDEIFYMHGSSILRILNMIGKLKEYKAVFIATFSNPNIGKELYWQFKNLYSLKNTFFIEHHINNIKDNRLEYMIDEKRIFSLSGYYNTAILNPHYFGEIRVEKKNKITKFFIVNKILGTKKYYKSIVEVSEKLIKNGIKDFNITMIGQKPEYEKLHSDNIETVSNFLYFFNFYEKVEETDFIIILLDTKYSNDDAFNSHGRYLNDSISGSYQLSLGFLKPCIIQKPFAESFVFNNDNSIIFENDNIYEALYKAITMSENDYKIMQDNLLNTALELEKKSLRNLKEAFEQNNIV